MSVETLILPESEIRERFQRLTRQWKNESEFMSNSAQMAMLPSYQHIIGLGMPVVPFVLEELKREPDQWFWALEAITEESPTPQEVRGKVALMAKAWLDWGVQRGFIKP